jgi:hypothetical protein
MPTPARQNIKAGVMVAKTKNYIDWKNRPFAKDANAEQKRQQAERFSALAEWIRIRGGFVTSPPGKVLRIEVPKNSELPAKLRELGYITVSHGSISLIVGTDYVRPSDELYGSRASPFAEYDVLEIRTDGR